MATTDTHSHELALRLARQAFESGVTRKLSFRRQQLQQVFKLVHENESKLVEALEADFRKPRFESIMTELDFVLNDIRSALNNLNDWTKPKFVSKCFVTLLDDNYIQYEPYGVVLVLSAWNYPVQLAFSPLVGAITAGNACIVKPSEVAPATAILINKLMPVYLDKTAYHCVMGDASCAQALVSSPQIDYVFFTGSSQIGKHIYQSAASNLTPCTLEMGGKSPAYIDEQTYLKAGKSFDEALFETSCRRIMWGKFLNTGQTCVAPDYVMCTEFIAQKFMQVSIKIIKEFYGESPILTRDYGRIINSRHFNRLVGILKAQLERQQASQGKKDEREIKLVGGGSCVDSDGNYYIEPTLIICGDSFDEPLMQSEIFGPILPVVIVSDETKAIEMINARDKPLSLYIFSKQDSIITKFRDQTSSGSICVNDTVIHLIAEALPFGGVGKSGMGAYHGKHTFKTFSHRKSVLVRGFNPIIEWVAKKRYPPYSENHLKRMLRLLKRRKNPVPFLFSEAFFGLVCLLMGALICYLYIHISTFNQY